MRWPVPTTLDAVLDSLEADHEFLLEGGVFTPDVIDTWISFSGSLVSGSTKPFMRASQTGSRSPLYLTSSEFRLAPFATRLFDLQRRSGIAAAPEFVFPLVSLLVLEGMINEFDVDVDFQAEAVPTLLSALGT